MIFLYVYTQTAVVGNVANKKDGMEEGKRWAKTRSMNKAKHRPTER